MVTAGAVVVAAADVVVVVAGMAVVEVDAATVVVGAGAVVVVARVDVVVDPPASSPQAAAIKASTAMRTGVALLMAIRRIRARPRVTGHLALLFATYDVTMATTRVLKHMDAPPQRVYRALIDPVAVQSWMVPDGMRSEVHSFEARVGGTFRITLTYDEPDATGKSRVNEDTFQGRFVKLIPNREVVQVIEFESDDPDIVGEMTISYSLSDAPEGGTNLVGVHENLPPGVSPEDNETGWQMSIDKLARLVEEDRAP